VPPAEAYRFRFFRAGGVDQVDLTDEGAILHLGSLDLKLWLALACPTHGLELDARTLELVDTDHDGRIRPPEVLAAVAWAAEVFANLRDLFDGKDELPLASLSKKTETGRAIRDGARRILSNLGRPDADTIRLEDVTNTERIFEQTTLNGDGVVPLDAADDEPTRKVLADILAVMGSVRDRSGKPGVDQTKADAFFDQVAAYDAWLAQSDAAGPVCVLGEATGAAFDAMTQVRAKLDDYFMRARLSAFDAKLLPALGAKAEEVDRLAGADLTPTDDRVARWPIAPIVAGAPLPLREGTNPAWTARVEGFARATVDPLLGAQHPTLTEVDWRTIQDRLAPYAAWMTIKPNLAVGELGAERVRELGQGDARKAVNLLIAKDAALETECNQIEAVEKAIRFRRDLVHLLRNFVNFADFYGKRSAVFQTGTLYIDGRSCDLCLPVHDVAKHAAIAGLAKACLVYCECVRKKDAEKRAIVAAVTAGGTDNLMVGRNGVFYDAKGDDWDATIVKIIENPTSVRNAFLAPYKWFVRAIERQVAKRATDADADVGHGLEEHAAGAVSTDAEKPVARPAPSKKIDIGTVAAIGVAVGGIAAFFSSVVATFLGLGIWMPLGVVALVLAISGPSMLIAWLKLSQRNIGPILDANGWAVNAFARINVPFGGALTKVAALPKGARRILDDPFAVKRPPYEVYAGVLFLVVIGAFWTAGKLDEFLPEKARAETVLHHALDSQGRAQTPNKTH
jgi:hypothetical protein